MSKRSALIIGGLSAAMVVSVAATGASAAPTPAPAKQNNAACPATPGVTPTTVNYGYISSRTGPAANTFSGAEEAARLRIAQENAKGGVNGRKIIMKGYDDQTSPTTQVSVVQQAIGNDSFGVSTATSTVSGYPTLKDQGIPVTGFNAQAFGQDRNAFGVTGPTLPPNIGGLGLIQKMQNLGVSKIANVNHSSAGATASGNSTSAAIKLVPGITESLRIADSPQGAHDATSEALRIKNTGSDGLIYVGFVEGGVSLAQALAQQGVKLKGMSITGLSDPAQLKTTGTALDGAIGQGAGTVPVGVNNPAVRTYANGMKAAGLNPYSTYAPIGYLGADLFIRGLKEAGPCPTRQKFIDNLRKVTNYTGGGLVPDKVKYTPGLTPNGDPISCGWYLTAKGNQLIPDAKATCGATYVDTATGKVVFQGHN
ncbi:MAG: ABC transporter substrate-binding protein [Candidatus Nanopelagicales bacterium]|nr:ABC transporter substrate-binding protein [Candidatus Nanopelagicales bacterium]